jgi:hypothetical protein
LTLASGWLWSLVLPAKSVAAAPRPVAPDRLASQLQARHLFGKSSDTRASTAGHPGNLRLVGAVSGEGIALIAVDGRPAQAFRVGAEIASGVRLTLVSARSVEIERTGTKEYLQLPVGRSSASPR